MKTNSFFKLAIVAVLFSFSANSYAQYPLIENFEYTSDTLNAPGTVQFTTVNNWSTVSNYTSSATATPPNTLVTPNALNKIMVTKSTLLYNGYPSSGQGNSVTLKTGGQGLFRCWPLSNLPSGTVFYLSFLADITALPSTTGSSFIAMTSYGTTSNYKPQLWVRASATSGKINFGIAETSTANISWNTADYDINTTYLFVLSYAYPGALAGLIVNPTVNAALPTFPNTIQLSAMGFQYSVSTTNPAGAPWVAGTNYVGVKLSQSGVAAVVSGIRISKTWSDIVGATTGISDVTKCDASVTVNAAKQIIVKVQELNATDMSVTVYNAMGQKVLGLPLVNVESTIDNKLGTGVYFVQVAANGKTMTEKVAIR